MWNKHGVSTSERGFSLIEVLVATALTGVVLTAIASVMTASIKNAAQTGYRSRATDIAQDGQEFFSREHALNGWSTFTAPFPDGTSTYCLKELPAAGQIAQLQPDGCGDLGSNQLTIGNGVFFREARISKDVANPNQLGVAVIVSWQDNERTVQVEVERIYQKQ